MYEEVDSNEDVTKLRNDANNIRQIHLEEIVKGIIERKINLGTKLIAYKNFENMIIHSLRSDNLAVSVQSDRLLELFKILKKNKAKVSLNSDMNNDSLFQCLTNNRGRD